MARLNVVKSFRGTSKTSDGNLTCGNCQDKIKPGDSYRWWSNRAPGMRGGYKQVRCMKNECTPTIAQMTPGRRGQLYQIQEDISNALADATTIEDLDSVRDDAAQQIRDLGAEFEEGADNMESGFGHETYQSQELREKAEALEAVADEIEGLEGEEPDEDEVEEFDEDEVGAELSQEMFGLDDPDEIEDDQDRSDWQEALDARREEHKDAQADAAQTSEDEIQAAVDEYRQAIEDAVGEADV